MLQAKPVHAGEKEMPKRKITTTDRQIDALVYELFPSG